VISVCYIIFPFVGITTDKIVQFILVLILQGIMKSFNSGGFTSIFILINHSVTGEKRARINGIAMMVNSFMKTVAPNFGGTLFAISISYEASFYPFNQHLTFVVTGMISFVCQFFIQLSKIKR